MKYFCCLTKKAYVMIKVQLKSFSTDQNVLSKEDEAANVLKNIGINAMVVYGQDGLDEIAVASSRETIMVILNENHLQPTIFYNNFVLGVEKSQENFNSCILEIYGDR